MNRRLFFECESGISGDMTVAALLDLGASRQVLDSVLKTIRDQSFSVTYSRVKKAGLDCMDFDVVLDREHESHDHDMAYLYGHRQSCRHGHDQEACQDRHHGHGGENCQGHHHGYDSEAHQDSYKGYQAGHGHPHRSYKEVMEIIKGCEMTPGARELTEKIFFILAEAESKAHGVPVEEVHFHEVGAIDSIVDIVSVAVCLDNLGYREALLPRLCEGEGSIRCQHGILPVPVPAVSHIVSEYGIPIKTIHVEGELVTPTGAAIAAAIRSRDELPGTYTIKRIGMGAGKRDYGLSGILRVMEIEDV